MRNGYSVIFLHRSGSLKPFLHHFSQHFGHHLDDLELKNDLLSFKANTEYKNIYEEYEKLKHNLLLVEFFSVSDYLSSLLSISSILRPIGKNSLLYLAAAVSDFYLPQDLMSEHKIQSGQGDLNLSLKPVPKMIKYLKTSQCPDAFIVSFKLETDEGIIVTKAKESLKNYGHHLVISNCLATRNQKVSLIEKEGESTLLRREGTFIEEDLVQKIIEKHKFYRSK